MLTPILPETDNIVCAECGRIATDMCPTPPDGHLIICPAGESCEVSLYEQNLDQGMTTFYSCDRCAHDWTEVA